MRRSTGLALRLAVAAAAAAAPALAQTDPASAQFVRRLNGIIASLDNGPDQAQAACTALVRTVFSIDAMAPLTSAGTWPQMTAQQKDQYRSALVRRAVRDCAGRRGEAFGQSLEFVGARDGGNGERLIATRINAEGRANRTLIWRVRPDAQGGLRAVDLMIDGRSIAIATRDDAKSILDRNDGDIDALIKALGG